jgi:hypothetical protein
MDVGVRWRAAAAPKIRSRARQENAYSPTGAGGSVSREPPRAGGVSG